MHLIRKAVTVIGSCNICELCLSWRRITIIGRQGHVFKNRIKRRLPRREDTRGNHSHLLTISPEWLEKLPSRSPCFGKLSRKLEQLAQRAGVNIINRTLQRRPDGRAPPQGSGRPAGRYLSDADTSTPIRMQTRGRKAAGGPPPVHNPNSIDLAVFETARMCPSLCFLSRQRAVHIVRPTDAICPELYSEHYAGHVQEHKVYTDTDTDTPHAAPRGTKALQTFMRLINDYRVHSSARVINQTDRVQQDVLRRLYLGCVPSWCPLLGVLKRNRLGGPPARVN